jgi:hypothetical protein
MLINSLFQHSVQQQMIPQKKGILLSFLELESQRVWHYQECPTPICRKKSFFDDFLQAL